MVIVVVRSGGVAGMTRRGIVDTTTLGSRASEWQQLVERALPVLDGLTDRDSPVRDGFVWRLEVGERSCETADSELTGPLRELAERTLKEGRVTR